MSSRVPWQDSAPSLALHAQSPDVPGTEPGDLVTPATGPGVSGVQGDASQQRRVGAEFRPLSAMRCAEGLRGPLGCRSRYLQEILAGSNEGQLRAGAVRL